jgi:PAS domain-containing protein
MTGLPEGDAGAVISQKSIELILLRELASRLTLPVALFDATRRLVYLNVPAEKLFAFRFEDVGEISQRAFIAKIRPTEDDGSLIPAEQMPSGVALNWRRPKHEDMWVFDARGEPHWIAVTGLPLDAQGGGVIGAMTIFWEVPDGDEPPPGT